MGRQHISGYLGLYSKCQTKKSINTDNNCFLDLCFAHALIHKVDKGYTEVTQISYVYKVTVKSEKIKTEGVSARTKPTCSLHPRDLDSLQYISN